MCYIFYIKENNIRFVPLKWNKKEKGSAATLPLKP